MKRFFICLATVLIGFCLSAQIQTKIGNLTLGQSNRKEVKKECKRIINKPNDYSFWREGVLLEDGEDGFECYSRTEGIIKFAGYTWDNMILQIVDNKIAKIQFIRSGKWYGAHNGVICDKIIDILLDKYKDYFLPELSSKQNAYIFNDGTTQLKLRLTPDMQLDITYSDISAKTGRYPFTRNGDTRSLFRSFSH